MSAKTPPERKIVEQIDLEFIIINISQILDPSLWPPISSISSMMKYSNFYNFKLVRLNI